MSIVHWIMVSFALSLLLLCDRPGNCADTNEHPFRLATFSADVTVPLGHRLMGVLPVKAERVVDPLQAHGFVLLGADPPIVVVSVDWCEIRNDAYDMWRDVLADAAKTSRERVLVSSIHQHDAPVIDLAAERLLAEAGLPGELCDVAFHAKTLGRVAAALRTSLAEVRPVTHIGVGQARAVRIASSRRVEYPDGRVDFGRGSNSGGNSFLSNAPEGPVDPWLKSLSFYHGETPLATLGVFAVHPMSYYGQGGVSADFVGMARRLRQRDLPDVAQIYASGCNGDVTAGKFNDGSPANRPVLAERMRQAMRSAWEATTRHELESVEFRSAELSLDFISDPPFAREVLESTLRDPQAPMKDRILAAMGLSSLQRIARGQPIDVPCIDFGPAQLVLLPGESFVAYQRMAQQMRPDAFVVCLGYGECWPGYVPTESALDEGFGTSWRWVGRGAEVKMRTALQHVLQKRGGSPFLRQNTQDR